MKETKENKNGNRERVRDALFEDCFGNVAGRMHCHILIEDMCLYGACPFYKTRAQFEADRKKYSGGTGRSASLRHGNTKKVRCITNGKIYMSVSEASWDTGVTVNMVSRVLTGRQKTASGFRFEYV